MVDLLFILLLVGLFAVTAGFVKVCDGLLGADEDAAGTSALAAGAETTERVAA